MTRPPLALQVCTKIVDCQDGFTYSYSGNYQLFLKLKRAKMDAWTSSYDAQQRKIKEDRNWINQNKNKPATASQVSLLSSSSPRKSPI